jgi:hypothetical protein
LNKARNPRKFSDAVSWGIPQSISWDILGFDDIGVSFLDNQKITVESHENLIIPKSSSLHPEHPRIRPEVVSYLDPACLPGGGRFDQNPVSFEQKSGLPSGKLT